jgi:hypothetical protein
MISSIAIPKKLSRQRTRQHDASAEVIRYVKCGLIPKEVEGAAMISREQRSVVLLGESARLGGFGVRAHRNP